MTKIPFDVEKAKKPGTKVVTRDGRAVLSWHHFPNAPRFPVAAHIDGEACVMLFDETTKDLFLEVEPILRPWKAHEGIGRVVRHKNTPGEIYLILQADARDEFAPPLFFMGMGGHRENAERLAMCYEDVTDGADNPKPCGVIE